MTRKPASPRIALDLGPRELTILQPVIRTGRPSQGWA